MHLQMIPSDSGYYQNNELTTGHGDLLQLDSPQFYSLFLKKKKTTTCQLSKNGISISHTQLLSLIGMLRSDKKYI